MEKIFFNTNLIIYTHKAIYIKRKQKIEKLRNIKIYKRKAKANILSSNRLP